MIAAPRVQHPLDLIREHPLLVAWSLLAAAAGLLRLIVIDRVPLSSAEASYALPAWQAVLGRLDDSLVLAGAPLLSHGLVLVFALFGASDATARLLPALAGIGLSLTPGLLMGVLGVRASLWAGVLIALSPIAVQSSRVVDPAALGALCAMVAVCSGVRLAADRPQWSPWTLAGALGLCLALGGGAVLALLAAAVAAVILFPPWASDPTRGDWRGRVASFTGGPQGLLRSLLGPLVLLVGVALLAATGGLMDLRGVGFVVVDAWGSALGLLATDLFPTRNIVALIAYAAPLLVLALVGYLLEQRDVRPRPAPQTTRGRRAPTEELESHEMEDVRSSRRPRFRVLTFFALWTHVLLIIAAIAGRGQLTLAALPIAPAAVLAATVLARIPLNLSAHQLSGEGWTILAGTMVLCTVAVVVFSQKVAAGAQVSWVASVALLGLFVLLIMGWRGLPAAERRSAAALLGGLALLGLTISGLSRASFGGGPPGTDLLMLEETAPAFRAMFRELNVLSSVDPGRALVVDLPEPMVASWYGRSIPSGSGALRSSAGAWVLRAETAPPSFNPAQVVRVPWKTTSEINAADVYPLGILRWLVNRSALVHPRPHDIIVTR